MHAAHRIGNAEEQRQTAPLTLTVAPPPRLPLHAPQNAADDIAEDSSVDATSAMDRSLSALSTVQSTAALDGAAARASYDRVADEGDDSSSARADESRRTSGQTADDSARLAELALRVRHVFNLPSDEDVVGGATQLTPCAPRSTPSV